VPILLGVAAIDTRIAQGAGNLLDVEHNAILLCLPSGYHLIDICTPARGKLHECGPLPCSTNSKGRIFRFDIHEFLGVQFPPDSLK
jgi:hypothetical protein